MNFEIKRVKISVTIPEESTDAVCDAACRAGAGIIGNYNFCTTQIKSIGTFIKNDKAIPYIGENNKLESVYENKLEVICDINIAKKVINELRKVHPYEEPKIDIFPLIDEKDLI